MDNGLKVNVEKTKLLDTLRENRTKHEKEFRKAFDVWKKRLESAFKVALARVPELSVEDALKHAAQGSAARVLAAIGRRDSKDSDPRGDLFSLSPPVHFLASYDQAIEMVEFHQGSTLELNSELFQQLMQDNWGWRHEYESTTQGYLA